MKSNRIFLMLSVLTLLVAFLAGCASQQAAATAEFSFEPFHTIVDMAFVEQHVSIPMAENVMLIDSRPYKPKYIEGHIPMAVSIPDSQFAKMTDRLPADKNALLIFYCGGLKCALSHKSAAKAEALGYKNVKVFAEGYPKWMSVVYRPNGSRAGSTRAPRWFWWTLVPSENSMTKGTFPTRSAFPICSSMISRGGFPRTKELSSCSTAAVCTAS